VKLALKDKLEFKRNFTMQNSTMHCIKKKTGKPIRHIFI